MNSPAPRPWHTAQDANDPLSWQPTLAFLRLGIAALLAGALLTALAQVLLAPQQPMRLVGPALVALIAVVAAVPLHYRKLGLTKLVLAGGSWGAFVGIALFTGGVRSPIAISFPLVILLCGWQINERAAIIVAALTVLAVLALVFAETTGWLPAPVQTLTAVHGAVQIILALLSAALIVLLVRAYRHQLRELDAVSSDLARRGSDLEQSQAQLHRAQAVASVGSWVFDLQLDRMQLSNETCRIFGLPQGTTGSHAAYLSRVFPGDREVLEEAWAAAAKGAGFDHEHRIVVGREVRWIRQKAEFEFAEDGTPLRAVGITQDISERRRADERIAELAFFDQLSGLPNRTLLLDRLRQSMAASARDGSYGALLFLDLDNFKTLNDTLGHDMGDLLLQQVGQRLMGCVRAGDTVARLGGDEFVVMLVSLGGDESAAANHAEVVGEKILAALNQSYQIGSHHHRSTPSIGVTLFGGGRQELIEEPLKRADLAMYQAKAAGRNTLRFFDPRMQAAVADRLSLELGLREALAQGEFLLVYQPQVTGAGRLTGVEALVRWRHPTRGMVLPAHFIALAEDTGLIVPLGNWVIRTACAQMAAWADQPRMSSLTMAVNVSARQFRQSDFVEQVLAAIEDAGANPRQLKLELTESLLVANVEDIIAKMARLKSHGVGFALDDFGTGYSSLSYLSRLPLDQLKIDRSFVMGIETSEHAVAICAATISLAHSLGLKVVAEGVETRTQHQLLHTLHRCDFIQGYLFGRPMPVAELDAFAQDEQDTGAAALTLLD
jgi:diguanylate cyclase (GGDEF)-like protein